ncbi:integration host factor subunit alpha [Desulfuromonas sp. CSMB_57]|jgi:integration host factor subunit alpha|uniref:integration host factor subunit alpha n=1 Tax=Desulfuromonas sp. CSMB_57 TaxID=2807629 RepID=UPI001CD7FDE9|nr:integration host factor subunit alpha [Desulfuromonas sp. CSMB_57]
MTKADLVEKVYLKTGFSKKESADIVEMVFDLMKDTLEQGEKIKLAGFGNFVVKQKATRRGRNPQTGDEIEISSRRILTFKPSQVLKSAINGQELELSALTEDGRADS